HQHHHPGQQQRPPLPQNFIAQQQAQQQTPPPPAKQDPPLPQEVAMIDMAAGLGAAWSTGDDRQQQRQGQSVAMATKQKQPHQQVVQPVRRQRLNSLHRSSSDPEFFTGRRRHFVPVQHKQQQAAGSSLLILPANKQAAIDAGLARLRLNSCKADQLQSIVTEPGTAAARPEASANSNSQAQAEPDELTSEPMPAAPSTIQETDVDETAQTAEAAAEEGDDEAPDEAEVHGLEDPMRYQLAKLILTRKLKMKRRQFRAEAAAVAAAEDAAKHAHLDKIVSHEALAEKLSTQAEEKPVPNSEWTSNEDYLARLQRLNTIKSVQSFWATLRYVPKVDLLPTKACYHFMRDDRLPICRHLARAAASRYWRTALSDWLAKGDDVSAFRDNYRAHLQQQKRQQLAADSQTSSSPPGLGGGQR
uniref:Swi3 domain-containing protein n=1 Tax=Macrostomum lignano TaxID=282301 RepID=A0A1I8JQY7_9PLAT